MRVLTVCREVPQNSEIHNFSIAEFIYEQNKSLADLKVNFDYYLIRKGGLRNYFKEIYNFRLYLKENNYKYDLIHAHGGHIGSIVNTQRKIPVVTTYHGSDINNRISRLISLISLLFSKKNIFVSLNMYKKVQKYSKGTVIPCGVDFEIFNPMDKRTCRSELGLQESDKIILFAGNPEKKVKNYKLAKSASELINQKFLMIALKDFKRKDVNLLLNGADLLLMTSLSEGSPQVIKEAMACNCPIVTTDVGDVREIILNTEGCFITSFDPQIIAKKIRFVMVSGKRTNGRVMVKNLNNDAIARKIREVYDIAIK